MLSCESSLCDWLHGSAMAIILHMLLNGVDVWEPVFPVVACRSRPFTTVESAYRNID